MYGFWIRCWTKERTLKGFLLYRRYVIGCDGSGCDNSMLFSEDGI